MSATVSRLADERSDDPLARLAVVHDPGSEQGWLELLTSGLSFDLVGLAPAGPAQMPEPVHRYQFAADLDPGTLEAIALMPGSHLAGGDHLIPVVRAMAALGVRLCALGDVAAVCWHPARTIMAPLYFTRIVGDWLGGKPFPALGLTALVRGDDGSFTSEGLAFLTGQELCLEPLPGEPPNVAAKLATRLIDRFVVTGRIERAEALTGPDGEALWAEPTADGSQVRVRRPT